MFLQFLNVLHYHVLLWKSNQSSAIDYFKSHLLVHHSTNEGESAMDSEWYSNQNTTIHKWYIIYTTFTHVLAYKNSQMIHSIHNIYTCLSLQKLKNDWWLWYTNFLTVIIKSFLFSFNCPSSPHHHSQILRHLAVLVLSCCSNLSKRDRTLQYNMMSTTTMMIVVIDTIILKMSWSIFIFYDGPLT